MSTVTLLMAVPLIFFFTIGCRASGYSLAHVFGGEASEKCSIPTNVYLSVQMLFTLAVQFPVFWMNLMACRGAVEGESGEEESKTKVPPVSGPAVV
jgi:hypothetical protein